MPPNPFNPQRPGAAFSTAETAALRKLAADLVAAGVPDDRLADHEPENLKPNVEPPPERFIGSITDAGPTGQNDFTDGRYWVRELVEVSPSIGPTRGLFDPLTFAPWPVFTEFAERFTREREEVPLVHDELETWVMATNIADLGVFGNRHTVVVGTRVILFRYVGIGGRESYVFTHTGASTRFGVVRDVVESGARFVLAQEVVELLEEVPNPNPPPFSLLEHRGRYTVEVDREGVPVEPTPVKVWPGFTADHYRGFVWESPGPVLPPWVNILDVSLIGGVWHIKPVIRWNTRPIPPGMRVTDCTPVDLGGLREREQ